MGVCKRQQPQGQPGATTNQTNHRARQPTSGQNKGDHGTDAKDVELALQLLMGKGKQKHHRRQHAGEERQEDHKLDGVVDNEEVGIQMSRKKKKKGDHAIGVAGRHWPGLTGGLLGLGIRGKASEHHPFHTTQIKKYNLHPPIRQLHILLNHGGSLVFRIAAAASASVECVEGQRAIQFGGMMEGGSQEAN